MFQMKESNSWILCQKDTVWHGPTEINFFKTFNFLCKKPLQFLGKTVYQATSLRVNGDSKCLKLFMRIFPPNSYWHIHHTGREQWWVLMVHRQEPQAGISSFSWTATSTCPFGITFIFKVMTGQKNLAGRNQEHRKPPAQAIVKPTGTRVTRTLSPKHILGKAPNKLKVQGY